MSEQPERHMIYCCCGAEAVQLEKPDDGPEIYLSFWSAGQDRGMKHPLLHRLRWAWMTLKWGTAYADQVVLSMDEAKKLRDTLDRMIGDAPHMVTQIGSDPAPTDRTTMGAVPADYITDGYEIVERKCPTCGRDTMQVIGIGRFQCSECG